MEVSNAYKKKGILVIEVFQYLFLLIFSNRSMYMSLLTGRNTPGFAKDTVYRSMKMLQINWIRFTTLWASRIIRDAIVPLDSEDRTNVLIIDDSMFERNRSKNVGLLAKFEIQYYKGQKFNSATEATKRGMLTATFTFKTGSAKDASLGSPASRTLAGAGGIATEHGIDFSQKADGAGNFVYDGDGKLQNDFLVDGADEYSKYIGQPETYAIMEIEPPVGYSLSGEMSGYQSAQNPPKVSYADETISLTDTISYSKMMVGANYKIKTKVIDMETGKELVDVNGNAVKVPDTEKTAEAEDGTWDIPISFAASKKNSDGTIAKTLAGKTIVVYEYVYIEKGHNGSNQWVLIADHEDFEDKDQRVYIPYIDTLATDQKTEQHISNAEKNMVIYDAVNYNKINPKYKYWLESELRDKATGEVVFDDAGVKQVIKTPVAVDAESGTIEPEHGGAIFHLDAESFAGRTLVVYERLFVEHGNNSYLIADHEVLLDEEQTIHIPKVWTNAMIEDMFSNTVSDKVRVIDTFSYDNLIPGLTYKLKGRVIDRDQSIQAGTDVLADNTAKNEMSFTPDSSSGAVRLSFDIPKQNSGIFVVYEELYVIDAYDGSDHEILVAKHTDIGDLNQTVFTNPTIETSLKDALTQSKILDAKKDACLTDAISYKNFDPRIPYTIKGKLIDMETGNTLIDAQGNKMEVEQSVAADVSGTGEWDVDYKFYASKLAGTVIVAFEEVYADAGEGKKLVSSHKEFWDDNQKVYIGDGNQIPPHYIHPLLLFSP